MNRLDTRLNEYGRGTRIEEEIQIVVVMVRKALSFERRELVH